MTSPFVGLISIDNCLPSYLRQASLPPCEDNSWPANQHRSLAFFLFVRGLISGALSTPSTIDGLMIDGYDSSFPSSVYRGEMAHHT